MSRRSKKIAGRLPQVNEDDQKAHALSQVDEDSSSGSELALSLQSPSPSENGDNLLAGGQKQEKGNRPLTKISRIKTITDLHKVKLYDEGASENEMVHIQISKDIYAALVLLIETGRFNKMDNAARCSLIGLTLIGAFIQFTSVLLLAIECFDYGNGGLFEDTSYVTIDGQRSEVVTYTGVRGNPLLLPKEWLWRICAFWVFLSYNAPFIGSTVDLSVLMKHLKHPLLFVVMSTFQIVITAGTFVVASNLVIERLDIIDIFSVGIGVVILLEVDEYLYQAIESSSPYINDALFEFEIKKQEMKHTLCENSSVLTMRFVFCAFIYVPLTLGVVCQILVRNVLEKKGVETDINLYFWYGVIIFVFFAWIYCVGRGCKAWYDYNKQ